MKIEAHFLYHRCFIAISFSFSTSNQNLEMLRSSELVLLKTDIVINKSKFS